MSGTFIVFEGPDGSGTTKHAALLAERLKKEGKEVVLTCEPTDGQYGQRLRRALRGEESLSAVEMQRLFCADRAEHIGDVIFPALRKGKIVVCDRYVPSTFVYGEAAGVSRALLLKWNEGFPAPDLIFVMLPPFDVCLERIRGRGARDAFEQEEFQRKVYDGYERYVRETPGVVVIDTSKGVEENEGVIWGVLQCPSSSSTAAQSLPNSSSRSSPKSKSSIRSS